jgi:flavin reductase (DIM6/NTAB) family NADH-FMN oxidoreductase RutF
MAKLVSQELTDDLYQRLSGQQVERHAEKVILISTVDANGWPHPAMLSYFEVIAKDRRNLRLAPYKDSASTNNMRRNGKLTISIIDERIVYYIKGTVEELSRQMKCSPHASKLNLRVEQVLVDQVQEPLEAEAHITGGVTYKGPNLAAALVSAKEVLRELLQ